MKETLSLFETRLFQDLRELEEDVLFFVKIL